jgi:hypothetical protein
MAFRKAEMGRIEEALDAYLARRRPPPAIRSKVDLGYRITGQTVDIFEIRPGWDDPSLQIEVAAARATFVRSREVWKVYWMRADLKWHPYPPAPTVGTIEKFLRLVEEDGYCCFFG